MRDRLIHGYGAVDYTIVYDTVMRKIPDLVIKLKAISER